MLTSSDIGTLAHKALLYEVSASPKPGLVDRFSSGIHNDMDFFTFIDSGASLVKYFTQSAEMGMTWDGDAEDLLKELRPRGIIAETEMFKATGGVNTHKGLIYALGLITAASGIWIKGMTSEVLEEMMNETTSYGFISRLADDICSIVQRVVSSEAHEIIKVMHASDTYGARQYKSYGMLGARGEAALGYISVRKTGLKALDKGLNALGIPWNEAMLLTLVELIAVVDDSNVAGKHSRKKMEESRMYALKALECGFPVTVEGDESYGLYIDWCQANGVSHGGAADLLAVTVYLWLIGDKIHNEIKNI